MTATTPQQSNGTSVAPVRRSLFEIAVEFRDAFDRLQESADDGGEVPDELAAAMDSVQMSFAAKLDACYRMYRHLETEAAGAYEELDRLKRLVSSRERRAGWMKQYILDSMLSAGVTKHEGPTCVMRVQRNSRPAISLEPGAEIPAEFKRIKEEFDSTAAYEAWKAKKMLPLCVRVIEGVHLRTGVAK